MLCSVWKYKNKVKNLVIILILRLYIFIAGLYLKNELFKYFFLDANNYK